MTFSGWSLAGYVFALAACLISPESLLAGPEIPPAPQAQAIPVKTTKPKYNKKPYLLVSGPMGLQFKSLQGPRFRRPPLLPPRKVENDVAATATPAPRPTGAAGKVSGPESILSSDPSVPPISIAKSPAAQSDPTPLTTAPPENTLTTPAGKDPDLGDAVIYFDAPLQKGATQTAPTAPANPPPEAPLHESSATYQQKE